VCQARVANFVDCMKFVVCSTVPDILPFFKAESGSTRLNSDAGNFMQVTGRQRAALAAVSALSLPGMLT